MSHPEILPDYLIRIGKKEGKDFIEILVESRTLDESLKRRLEEEIYNYLGFRAQVVLHPKGKIPRREGKAVRVEKIEKK